MKEWPGETPLSGARKKSTLALAEMLIESLREPSAFWRAFKSVKFDSSDSEDYDGERIVVIVAKAEAADRISEAYFDAMQYEQTVEGLIDG